MVICYYRVWTGLLGPARTLGLCTTRNRRKALVLPLSPADFGKLIAEDTEKWAKVIRAAIKAE